MTEPRETRLLAVDELQIPALTLGLPGETPKVFPGSPVTIGSSPDCDLVLASDTVSRHHCQLLCDGFGVILKDLDSTNGTWFGPLRVKEAVLSAPCEFQVGDQRLQFSPVTERFTPGGSGDCHLEGLVGASPAMCRLYSLLRKLAVCDAPVLIQGETGSGKELAARALHRLSRRAQGPFVTVDCSCLSPSLLESELFGHRKGSFTGALEGRIGLLELGDGGTVFLDEVGELPLELQPKLLRVLEARELRPVGASTPRPLNIRVLAATNRDLPQEVQAGRFRRDLLFRLEVLRVHLPPLRDRLEDLPLLLEHLLERLSPGAIPPSFTPQAMRALGCHPWPGNVRELANVVARALALSSGGAITEEELGLGFSQSAPARTPNPGFKEAKEEAEHLFEREYLRELFRRCDGNISRAGREADLDRKHLRRLLRRHGLIAEGED